MWPTTQSPLREVPSFERRELIQCSVSWHPTNQLIPSISITHNGSGLVILCISFRHNGGMGGKCSRHPWGGRSVWRPIDDICPPISSLNSQPTLPHCTLLSGLHHLFSLCFHLSFCTRYHNICDYQIGAPMVPWLNEALLL